MRRGGGRQPLLVQLSLARPRPLGVRCGGRGRGRAGAAVARDRVADRVRLGRARVGGTPRRVARAAPAACARRASPRARGRPSVAPRDANLLRNARVDADGVGGARRALRTVAGRVPRARRASRDTPRRDQLRRSGRTGMSLLRDRRLTALLAAEVISSLGTQMTWLALPWFVLRTTGSPQRMTWVLIAEILPVAVLGFWGGAIAGRVGTRRTMLVCDFARAPLFASIPLLHSAGLLPFPALLAPVAASGVFLAPYFSVQRAVVPELVGEEQHDVAYATAFFQAANRLTIFLGPPLAGVLIALIGTAQILYVDAATYLVSFALVAAFVHPPEVPAPDDAHGVLAGVRFVLRDKLLRIWTPSFTVIDISWTLLFASLPVLVVTQYHADPHILGWLFGALGGGALVGAFVSMRMVRRFEPLALSSAAS